MSYLLEKKCVPCEGGMPALLRNAIDQYMKELKEDWIIEDDKKIKKEFTFASFTQAIEFINQIAKIAQEQNHHPDICIFYRTVHIELWTHAISGLSENDFILAAHIEKIAKQFS